MAARKAAGSGSVAALRGDHRFGAFPHRHLRRQACGHPDFPWDEQSAAMLAQLDLGRKFPNVRSRLAGFDPSAAPSIMRGTFRTIENRARDDGNWNSFGHRRARPCPPQFDDRRGRPARPGIRRGRGRHTLVPGRQLQAGRRPAQGEPVHRSGPAAAADGPGRDGLPGPVAQPADLFPPYRNRRSGRLLPQA